MPPPVFNTPEQPQDTQPVAPDIQPDAQQTPKLPFRRVQYKTLKPGGLVSFRYTFWKHDPSPLVLVTDVALDTIRGVNLHYLTFKYMKKLLDLYCDKDNFKYRLIQHDRYVVYAFRTYKRLGMNSVQLLDCEVINKLLNVRRSFNPQEMKAIREQLQKDFERQANLRADDLSGTYTETLRGAGEFEALPKGLVQDGRRAFKPIPSIPSQPASIPPLTTNTDNQQLQ